jgi:hypothetical protein
MRSIILALVLLTPAAHAAPADFPALVGRWKSIACELRPAQGGGETYLKRDITFTAKTIDIQLDTFEDAACTKPKITMHFAGSSDVVGPSTVAAGAREVNLAIDTVDLIPHTEAMAGYLNSAGKGKCGAAEWKPETKQRISETGCTVFGVGPKAITREFEVLHVVRDFLFFGARPIDGSMIDSGAKRPHALQMPIERASK